MTIERFGAAPTGPGGRSLPFTKAVRAGDFIFVSGQVPMGADGEIVDGNIATQTKQTIENVKAILQGAGPRPRTCGEGHRLACGHARLLALQQGLSRIFRRGASGAVLRAGRHDGGLQGGDRGCGL